MSQVRILYRPLKSRKFIFRLFLLFFCVFCGFFLLFLIVFSAENWGLLTKISRYVILTTSKNDHKFFKEDENGPEK